MITLTLDNTILKIIHMNKVNKIDKAYSGKIVYHGNRPYQLVPELKKGMCEGCSLYNSSCPTRVTGYCTQGYILKKIIL